MGTYENTGVPMPLKIPKDMKPVVEAHMQKFPKGWTIYSVAKVLGIPESEAPLLLNGMNGPDRLKLVYAGKVKAEHSMEGSLK